MSVNTYQLHELQQMIQNGHKHHAANILTVLLANDYNNAEAWWLMALAAPDAATERRALEQVLRLRPNDHRARQRLDSLNVRDMMSNARRATQERARVFDVQAAGFSTGSMNALAVERPFEDSRPMLRRRSGGRSQPVRVVSQQAGRDRMFPFLLAAAILFGLMGCSLLAMVTLNGIGQAVSGFATSLPNVQVDAGSPSQPNMGNVNAQGNLSYYQFRSGALAAQTDQHAYTFTGGAGDHVLIELTALDAMVDPAVALYGPDNALIGGNMDVMPETRDARLSVTLPTAGTYTILVSSEAGQGTYQVTLRRS